jgi:hypothetical protein
MIHFGWHIGAVRPQRPPAPLSRLAFVTMRP